MNIPITASKLIDRAILLNEGGAIVIPCNSYEEMESLRIRLYKLKRQLEAKCREEALSLDITRKVGINKWTVFIRKDTSLSGILIIEDGEARPFDFIDEEEKRIEELKETEVEKEVEDFDEIAFKIEQEQGILEEEEEGEIDGAIEKTGSDMDSKCS